MSEVLCRGVHLIRTCTDPKYEEEVSGCTASVGLISKTMIYVVSSIP